MHPLIALVVAVALSAGCAGPPDAAAGPTPAPEPSSTTAAGVDPHADEAPPPADDVPPPDEAPEPQDLATTCRPWDDGAVAPEAAPLTDALAAHLGDPRLAGNQVSVSVWVDGLGEVLAYGGDERLLVASNQKILTAMGALDSMDIAATLRTEVVVDPGSGPSAGVVEGDLVLVAGGDPTLSSTGPHSLASLAEAVRAAGITEVQGGLVVDESRYGPARSAPGWQDWHIPAYAGPLSALVVDDNRGRADPAFLADPALGHAEAFRDLLAQAGVTVAGPVTAGSAPVGATGVAGLDSPPLGDLLLRMLLSSDNEVAEALTREAGVALTGTGSTPAGTAALESRLRAGCAPLMAGGWGDGSGLSRDDRRSARELRRVLQHARTEPWWSDLEARLPVAGRSGTLRSRLVGTAAEGRVAAKTGTIIGGTSLSGVVTTASGHQAVFSLLVNGDGAGPAMRALDGLVATLAAS